MADMDETEKYSTLEKRQKNTEPCRKVLIDRPVYSQPLFDEGYEPSMWKETTMKERFVKCFSKCTCSKKCAKTFLFDHFPFIPIMKNYKLPRDLVADLIAGLTVGVMHIPQGMAYGMLAGLPPVYGLYVSFLPTMIYFFLGSSKHASVGTFAVVSIMISNAVDRETGDLVPTVGNMSENATDTGGGLTESQIIAEQVGVAMALTFIGGLIQILMGFMNLGFLCIYLSDPMVAGYTAAAACIVVTSQIQHVLGVYSKKYVGVFKLFYTYGEIFEKIHTTNIASLVTSLIAALIMILVKECINNRFRSKMKMPVPIEIIVVVFGTIASYFINLNGRFGTKIVGTIPSGFPAPKPPDPKYMANGSIVVDALLTVIIAYSVSMSLAKIMAKRRKYQLDYNQELYAYGFTNTIGSFFGCFVAAASLSRTSVQEVLGGVTQIAGVVGSLIVLVVLLWIGPLFQSLPNGILAVIIIVNLKGMFKQFGQLKKLWRISKYDFVTWLVSWAAPCIFDMDIGLGIAMGFSLLSVILRTQKPYACILGRIPGTDIYRDLTLYQSAAEIKGIRIFRFEGSIYFASAENFRDVLYKMTKMDPRILAVQRQKVASKWKKDKVNGNKKKMNKVFPIVFNEKTPLLSGLTSDVSSKFVGIAHEENANEVNCNDDGQVSVNEEPVLPSFDIHHLIIDCSTWAFIDSMGCSVLNQLIADFRDVGITVYLANCKGQVRHTLHALGFFKSNDKEALYISIHDAAVASLQDDIDSHEHQEKNISVDILTELLNDTAPSPSIINTNEMPDFNDYGNERFETGAV